MSDFNLNRKKYFHFLYIVSITLINFKRKIKKTNQKKVKKIRFSEIRDKRSGQTALRNLFTRRESSLNFPGKDLERI